MRSIYVTKNPAVYISTFKQAMSLIRKHPECSKYQKRKRHLAFLKEWNSWDYSRQCGYLC